MAVAAEGKPTILVAEKLGAGGVDMLKEVGALPSQPLPPAWMQPMHMQPLASVQTALQP